jgi:hypothetical protein
MKRFPKAKSMPEALAKWHATAAGKMVSQSFVRDIYERQQKAGYGDALGSPAWNGATGSGQGFHPDTTGSGLYPVTAANRDGTKPQTSVATSVPLVSMKKHINKENIDALMQKIDPDTGKRVTFERACTALDRGYW